MGDNGFPKETRLLRSKQFDLVWKQGRRHHTPHFIVVIRSETASGFRVGLTVSRKVGGAVERNRLKRRLREFFRNRRCILCPVDVVVVAKAGASGLTFVHIADELMRVLPTVKSPG